jgi:excinuclease ABC A subunit
VVVTGVSGSGKSSLAFDTIYAEGQRRYVESLSAYARQFLELMEKPDVDVIEGLSPAISIEQRTLSRNPRSTVGTVTEIYDYLRLLYARVGRPACWKCGREIASQGAEQITDRVLALPAGARVHVLAPLVRGRKGEGQKVFEEVRRKGYVRVRVDGQLRDLGGEIALDKKKKHTIEAVIDRLVVGPEGSGTRVLALRLLFLEVDDRRTHDVLVVDGHHGSTCEPAPKPRRHEGHGSGFRPDGLTGVEAPWFSPGVGCGVVRFGAC